MQGSIEDLVTMQSFTNNWFLHLLSTLMINNKYKHLQNYVLNSKEDESFHLKIVSFSSLGLKCIKILMALFTKQRLLSTCCLLAVIVSYTQRHCVTYFHILHTKTLCHVFPHTTHKDTVSRISTYYI